jgi:hypothetical protein
LAPGDKAAFKRHRPRLNGRIILESKLNYGRFNVTWAHAHPFGLLADEDQIARSDTGGTNLFLTVTVAIRDQHCQRGTYANGGMIDDFSKVSKIAIGPYCQGIATTSRDRAMAGPSLWRRSTIP